MLATALTAPDGRAENEKTIPSVRRILFVGLKDCYLSSDYYTGDQIAETFDVAPGTMDEVVNSEFYGAFSEAAGKRSLSLTACDDAAQEMISDLQYDYDGDVLYSNLSEIDENLYRSVLEQAQAEYMLVIDQYYIKKEIYPYDNFAHTFHYSVYDTSKNKIYDGHYRFTAFDLGTLSMLQKQMRKAADKCIRNIGDMRK
jgi:hypothetical protein